MISISEKAMEILARLTGLHNYVRIEVKSGGCAGMTYDANIVTDKSEQDHLVYQQAGVRVIADPQSLPYLEGLEIDYSDDLISAGFRFSNQSNDSSCGCGASFTLSGFPEIVSQGVSCGS